MTLTSDQNKAIKLAIPISYTIKGIPFIVTVMYWNQEQTILPDYRIIIKNKVQNIENLRDITNQVNWPKSLISFNIYAKDYVGPPKIAGITIVWEIARQLTKYIEDNWDTILQAYNIRIANYNGNPAVGAITDLSNLIYNANKTKQNEYRVQFDLTITYRFRPE